MANSGGHCIQIRSFLFTGVLFINLWHLLNFLKWHLQSSKYRTSEGMFKYKTFTLEPDGG